MARWIRSAVLLEDDVRPAEIIGKIERACRTCYKSEDKICEGSAERLIRSCIKRGHHSILEHANITFRIICDRGVSHEIVRHRIAAYSQESTRYCNYTQDKFDKELTFIYPSWTDIMSKEELENNNMWKLLKQGAEYSEFTYNSMVLNGAKPEVARAILPNCLKTELVMTMNIRELRHFLTLRCSQAAHPDIREVAFEILNLLVANGLGIFIEDLEVR
jgi:thymidylate synthase (FAD)